MVNFRYESRKILESEIRFSQTNPHYIRHVPDDKELHTYTIYRDIISSVQWNLLSENPS